jgi:CDP-diglyceride synthetase
LPAIWAIFESWVKRQFRAKNTGNLIPSWRALDRIDLCFLPRLCALLSFILPVSTRGGGA